MKHDEIQELVSTIVYATVFPQALELLDALPDTERMNKIRELFNAEMIEFGDVAQKTFDKYEVDNDVD